MTKPMTDERLNEAEKLFSASDFYLAMRISRQNMGALRKELSKEINRLRKLVDEYAAVVDVVRNWDCDTPDCEICEAVRILDERPQEPLTAI